MQEPIDNNCPSNFLSDEELEQLNYEASLEREASEFDEETLAFEQRVREEGEKRALLLQDTTEKGMYLVINTTKKTALSYTGGFPSCEEALCKGDKLIVVSLYSNTVKIPKLVNDYGEEHAECLEVTFDRLDELITNFCWSKNIGRSDEYPVKNKSFEIHQSMQQLPDRDPLDDIDCSSY